MWIESAISRDELLLFLTACARVGFDPASFQLHAEQAGTSTTALRIVTITRGRRAISVADSAEGRWVPRALEGMQRGMLGRPLFDACPRDVLDLCRTDRVVAAARPASEQRKSAAPAARLAAEAVL